jgi:hypothetical protein
MPDDVLTAVSVPAIIIVLLAYRSTVAVVNTRESLMYEAVLIYKEAAYNVPPIPTPPSTINAPVVVETEGVVFVMWIALVVVEPLEDTESNVL